MPKYDKAAWSPRDYQSLDELKAELDRFEVAHRADKLATTGGWSAGQILEHCSNLMRFSLDGFDASIPWPVRMLGAMIFKPMLGRSHMKPGIKLPAGAKSLMPRDEVPFEEGLAKMRQQLARIDAGEKMTQPSPVLGKMRHEQWVLLHRDHCRMHFGFIRCG